jgi:hypothetical protein
MYVCMYVCIYMYDMYVWYTHVCYVSLMQDTVLPATTKLETYRYDISTPDVVYAPDVSLSSSFVSLAPNCSYSTLIYSAHVQNENTNNI